ncbi:pilus assembly protein [Streptomyces sp. KK5PA1]|uniref:Pilus assembly protein n=1 Tax=Actinacidiphila acididurans TaxID=2784346 RepID=A0ABS2TQY7_9ACTN|nr:pilus assembly protein [Actinacidiphila acididurans]
MFRSERCRSGPRGRDGGYVTAETAMVIPVLVALTGLLIWGLMAAAAQVRCIDAARAGARAAARSETPDVVRRMAQEAAPAGARVTVVRDGDLVRVRVTVPVPRYPVPLAAEAAALAEDAVPSQGAGP